jgi:hypothetical protein
MLTSHGAEYYRDEQIRACEEITSLRTHVSLLKEERRLLLNLEAMVRWSLNPARQDIGRVNFAPMLTEIDNWRQTRA